MQNYEERAIPLISRLDGKKYEINPEALKFFASIKGKIAIISVAGAYRTGKSYLLNTILLNQKAGFAVGPTTNPKTKGIWVWGQPLSIKNEKDEIINVCVLDSQGLGSIEEDINHDLRLFSLTVLLSSMFIYNTLGAIDQNAIDNLGLVLKLCEHLKAENYNDFPDFYWVLRDFSLALVGKDNKPLSASKYLQNALSPQSGDSEIRNKIRQSIRSSFPTRSCFTFVRPLMDQSFLQNLQKMQIDQLRPQFMEQVIDFRKLINSNLKTKRIKGKEINSSLLIELIQVYVNEINGKEVPNIESGWKYVCRSECELAMKMVEEQAEMEMGRLMESVPASKKELNERREEMLENLHRVFESRTMNNDQGVAFKEEINKLVEKKIMRIEEEMKLKNSQDTKSFIRKEFEVIERRLKQNQFKSMGELVKEFEVFYEYFRKKCPYKDEIQTGLEFLIKKFSDCSLLLFKAVKSKKDQQVAKLKEEIDRLTSELSARDERQKHEKTASSDKNAIQESKIEELMRQVKELSDSLMKVEQEYQKLKLEEEETKNSASQESEYELIVVRKKLMEAEDYVKEMECKKNMQVNNFKNTLVLKDNEIAHILEDKLAISQKLAALSQELSLDRDQKVKKYDQLYSSVQLLKLQNENLKKNYEQKINVRDVQIGRLENAIDAKNNELTNLSQQNERTLKTLLENFEQEKVQLNDSSRQEIKGLKQATQAQQEYLSIKLKQAESEYTQREMELKMKNQEVERELALISQKLQFLRFQCEEKEKKIGKATEEACTYRNLFEQKQNQLFNTKNLLQDLRGHCESNSTEMSRKVQQMSEQLQEKNKQISHLEQIQENNNAALRDKAQQIKSSQQKLRNIIKNYEEKLKQLNDKLAYQMEVSDRTKAALQSELQAIKSENSKNMQEQKRNAELSLVQLKNYYEMERERLEKKNLQDRKKHQYTESSVTSELQSKHRKTQRALQEEIQQLKISKQNLEEQMGRLQNDCEIRILNMEEERDNEKRVHANRYELMEKKYGELQTDFEAYEKSYEQERITFVKRIEALNFQLSRREKQLMQTNSRREALEGTLAKREAQLQNTRKIMNQEIEASLKKVSEVQAKYQRLNEEFMQIKIESEKQIALSKQRNEFLNAKLADLTKEKQVSSSKNLEKIDKLKISELKQQSQKYKSEIMSLQGKLQNYRKVNKEQQSAFKKQLSAFQKENEFLRQKESISEAKITDLQAKVQQKTESFLKELQQSRTKNMIERELIQKECDQLRERITTVEDEKNSVAWNLQKDIALLNEKMKYAEYQRDQAKKDLEESQKRLQQAIMQLRKATEKANEDSEAKKNQSQKKFAGQIQLLREQMSSKREEYQQTTKKHMETIKILKDKNLELVERIQNIDKIRNNQKNMQQQIDTLKKEKEILMSNYRSERSRDNEEWKKKYGDIEKRLKEAERKNMDHVFALEKESSKWQMERQNLLDKMKALEDTIEWDRSKLQLNKSKHELKKSESSSIFNTEYGKFTWKS